MNISVFGLGYVGVVTSACLARSGFAVVGVDTNAHKVDLINSGHPPIIELGLSELIKKGLHDRKLKATTSAKDAVLETDVSFISVGTPSKKDGSPDLSYLFKVCTDIGKAVSEKGTTHVIIIRSTVLPGTTSQCEALIKELAGKVEIHTGFNPEFLREGCAIRDYDSPPYTIIGTRSDIAEKALRRIYAAIDAPVLVHSPEVAEMIKFTSNAWHALKISFANEIGRISKSFKVDGREVMQIFSQDTKLNISKSYLLPGFAFGGSCLPKDVRGLLHCGKIKDISLPLLNAIMTSNQQQIEYAFQRILETDKKKIGLLGLSFKAGTDDLRESPAVNLAESLIGKGYSLKIMDNDVNEAKLMGANKKYIEEKIPHLSSLLVSDPSEIIGHSEVMVITHTSPDFRDTVQNAAPGTLILDFAGLFSAAPSNLNYDGIAW